MDNNDVLRGLRYALQLSDGELARIMALGGEPLSISQVQDRLMREGEVGAVYCTNEILGAFLDGLIVDRRGPPDPDRPAPPKLPLSNNEVLKKIRVALKLRDAQLLEILEAGGQPMSKAELSALFRKPSHRHFRLCGDQIMRVFLRGLGRLR